MQLPEQEILFLEDGTITTLPPHRLGHDIEIHLENGKTPPYGPLYEMSLPDPLDKG